ncbi:MAG: hypothetical protein E7047_07605 [Lentisphaerae bacterium]|nr:hypothetical protein [Lentisphaerota bacterium]
MCIVNKFFIKSNQSIIKESEIMRFSTVLSLLLLLSVGMLNAGEWSMSGQAPFTINCQDRVIVADRHFTIHGVEQFTAPEAQSEMVKTTDGKWQVFNRWCKNYDGNFREELAVSQDGKLVELSFQSFFESYSPAIMKKPIVSYMLELPYSAVAGMRYKALTGRVSNTKVIEGEFPADVNANMKGFAARFVALEGKDGRQMVIDFNPQGVGDYHSDYGINAFKGLWTVVKVKDKVRLFYECDPDEWGGPMTSKVRFYTGSWADYDKTHAMNFFNWGYPFNPEKQYSFGAAKTSKIYTKLATGKFDGQVGWTAGSDLKVVNENPSGARYSSVTGKNGKIRVANLRHALYWVTVGSGNLKGSPKQFQLKFNNVSFNNDIKVPTGQFVTAGMPIWIGEDGILDVELAGDFQISTLALQCLVARAEDMNFERSFYLTDGFEPSVLYKRDQYTEKPVFAQRVESFTLPVPGKETAGQLKSLPLKSNALKSAEQPGADWRYNSVIQTFGPNNAGTLHDFNAPGTLERRVKELKDNNVNVIITNGMLSRHTYYAHMPRIKENMKRYADEAHKQGLRLMDHQDVTLLWNVDAGFRAASERFDELQMQFDHQLPSPYFCFNNPKFKQHYFEYIKDYVQYTNVDAIMFDEVMMMDNCCTCAYCREKFHKDTNWFVPADDTALFTGSEGAKLRKVWNYWRMVQVGDFFTELRAEINKVKPDFSIVAYVTHYCFTSRYSSIGYGLDIVQMSRAVDFPGTEITTRNVLRGARCVNALRRSKSMLNLAYGTPVWGLIGSGGKSYQVVYAGWAINNMNGHSTWINDPSRPPAGEKHFLNFADRNMNVKQARSVAEVALLFSSNSRDFGGGFNYSSELMGTAQTLGSMHVPYDVIGEMSLNAQALSKYKVLVLGCSSALSDANGDAIKEFARNGGTVYLTTTAGWEDEFGNSRKKWLFYDVFNHDINRKFTRPKTITDPTTGKEVQLKFEPYYCHPDYTKAGPRPGSALLWARNANNQRYPLMVKKSYGKGTFYYQPITLALHLNAPEGYVGKKFDFEIDPWLDNLYRDLLAKIIGDANIWQVEAPDLVLTSIYKQDNSLYCHFFNATLGPVKKGEVIPFGVPDPAFPALEKDITFTIKSAQPARVVAISPDFDGEKALSTSYDAARNALSVTLNKELLKAYTIVRIDY